MISSLLQRVFDLFFAWNEENSRRKLSYISLLAFHGYFILGITWLEWPPDIVLFGYFLEAMVQLLFTCFFILSQKEYRSFKKFLKFSAASFIGSLLYFVFIILVDFALREPWRSDSLMLKIALTLNSLAPNPAEYAEDFFVNQFSNGMRNEFLLESFWALLLAVFHHLMEFLRMKKHGEPRYPSMISLWEFWFLAGFLFVLKSVFELPISLGFFIIAGRIIFDWAALAETSQDREKKIKYFLLHIITFGFFYYIIMDVQGLFMKILCFGGAVMVVAGTRPTVHMTKKLFNRRDYIIMGAESLVLFTAVLIPYISGDFRKEFTETLKDPLQYRCFFGDREKCIELESGILNRKLNWQRMQKAMDKLSDWCESESADACYELGIFNIDEIGGVKIEVGEKLLQRACGLKHAFSCLRLTENDKAEKYLLAECESGNGERCFNLGRWIENQKKDLKKAEELYRRGCEMESPNACNSTGYFLAEHHGQLREGQRYYIKACRSGLYTGCVNAALLYAKGGGGVPEHHSHAQSLLYLSCSQGKNGYGCYEYSLFLSKYGSYDEITGLSKGEAADKMREACRLGYEKACR